MSRPLDPTPHRSPPVRSALLACGLAAALAACDTGGSGQGGVVLYEVVGDTAAEVVLPAAPTPPRPPEAYVDCGTGEPVCWTLDDREDWLADVEARVYSRDERDQCRLTDPRFGDVVIFECGILLAGIRDGVTEDQLADLVERVEGRVLRFPANAYETLELEVPEGAERSAATILLFDPRVRYLNFNILGLGP